MKGVIYNGDFECHAAYVKCSLEVTLHSNAAAVDQTCVVLNLVCWLIQRSGTAEVWSSLLELLHLQPLLLGLLRMPYGRPGSSLCRLLAIKAVCCLSLSSTDQRAGV